MTAVFASSPAVSLALGVTVDDVLAADAARRLGDVGPQGHRVGGIMLDILRDEVRTVGAPAPTILFAGRELRLAGTDEDAGRAFDEVLLEGAPEEDGPAVLVASRHKWILAHVLRFRWEGGDLVLSLGPDLEGGR